MKITAIIDDGLSDETLCRSRIQAARDAAHADAVAVIMAGYILHDGSIPQQPAADRAARLTRAGADLVVEAPIHGVILKPDTYAYVMAMLLLKMNCVESLYLPCRPGDAGVLEQAAQLMLLAPREYQQVLKQLRPGRELFDVIPEAVGRFIPGTEEAMANPMNRFAVEIKNALRLSYCPTRGIIAESDLGSASDTLSPEADRILGRLLQERIRELGQKGLMEIFGSTESRVDRLMGLNHAETYTELAQGLQRQDYSILSARQFLLRILLDFRHISHSMCALHSYIFHIRLLDARNEAAAAELAAKAAVGVIRPGEEVSEAEQLAQKLYDALCK